ncbi:type II toxin-antitoxin system HicB family antitoxin [bacterium]|nr:type II toxin-antitoxin system HicB family antitoxin [bacterium]
MKTTNEYQGYVFSIEYMPDDKSYVVDFPDIPEIITSGSTLDEAFHNACEALDLHLESLKELGLPLPRQTRKITIVSA